MLSAGLDIGSRTVKLAVLKNSEIILKKVISNTFEPEKVCIKLLDGIVYDKITVTGYGRHLISRKLGCQFISEIKAFCLGAKFLYPNSDAVLDIGGQDIKSILIDANGNIEKFEMNDKCAAGTGKFLEIMSSALNLQLDEFSEIAMQAEKPCEITHMCAVFAESEVISAIANGIDRKSIALGVHYAAARRAISILKKTGIRNNTVFAGGTAFNKCLRILIENGAGIKLVVTDNPQIVGALGAALN